MAQIFYIESDEEIIGAIGRLRHSPEQENYFVFPKRALILQSVINLRLFQKEAQKMKKSIIIVTQDEIGKLTLMSLQKNLIISNLVGNRLLRQFCQLKI
jgi:hypothetical protein